MWLWDWGMAVVQLIRKYTTRGLSGYIVRVDLHHDMVEVLDDFFELSCFCDLAVFCFCECGICLTFDDIVVGLT